MGTINHEGLVNGGFKLDQEEEQTRAKDETENPSRPKNSQCVAIGSELACPCVAN